MRKLVYMIGALLALITPLVAFATPSIINIGSTYSELAAVRQATATYIDVHAAIADGYLPTEACAELPGQGGMGYHYINPQLASDLASDPLKPEILLYTKEDNQLKLVGVEYFQAEAGQPHPVLFGQPFDGPMPGHEPGMPTHYDLHVWLWQHNPNGIFASWNPTVHC